MSESDWKTVEDAFDMWRATQVAIRGHVQTVSEAFGRLRELRKRDSELILRLAKERNDARANRDSWMWERNKELGRAETAEARVKELEEELRKIESLYPRGEPAFEIAHDALGT